MRLLKTLFPGLLALLMLGLAAAPIAAQTENPGEEFDFADLEGVQRAYSRTFTADFMAMFSMATPDAAPTGWFVLNTMAVEFDSEDNATAGHDAMLEEIEASDMTGEDIEFTETELDVEFDHTALQATQEEEGMTTHIVLATAQEGTRIYTVVGVTFGVDPIDVVSSTLTSIYDADAEGGDGAFSEDGTSEGGLWATLPTLEQMQEIAPELIQVSDQVIFPESEATPAA